MGYVPGAFVPGESGKKESTNFSVSLVSEFSCGPARKEMKDLIAYFVCYVLAVK
jgi:hypothetical protein